MAEIQRARFFLSGQMRFSPADIRLRQIDPDDLLIALGDRFRVVLENIEVRHDGLSVVAAAHARFEIVNASVAIRNNRRREIVTHLDTRERGTHDIRRIVLRRHLDIGMENGISHTAAACPPGAWP